MQYAIAKRGLYSTIYVTKISRDGVRIDNTFVHDDERNAGKTPYNARRFTLDGALKALANMQNGLFDDYDIIKVA